MKDDDDDDSIGGSVNRDDDGGEPDVREELYRSFRTALKKPVLERYFDEADLVEIFDYAGDLEDTYVRAEVLFLGARLYPDSQPLSARRALFYAESLDGRDAFDAYVDDNLPPPSSRTLLWKLAKVLRAGLVDEEAELALDDIVATTDSFADEDIIRLVKLCSAIDQLDWMQSRMDALRKKTSYLPALLFEAGQMLADAGQWKDALPYYEELTRLEPFESSYWALYYNALVMDQRFDEAREAFDFAANLEIKDTPTAVLLASHTVNIYPELRPAALDIVAARRAAEPEDAELLESQVQLLSALGRHSAAERQLSDFLADHPGHWSAVFLAIQTFREFPTEIFNAYVNSREGQSFDEEATFSTAVELLRRDRNEAALLLLIHALQFIPASNRLIVLLADTTSGLGQYDKVREILLSYDFVFSLLGELDLGPRAALLWHKSLTAQEKFEEAAEFASRLTADLRELLDRNLPYPYTLAFRGLINSLAKD